MVSRPVRVVVRDDYDIVTSGLVKQLAPFTDRVCVVGTSSGGEQLDLSADVVLLNFDGSYADECRINQIAAGADRTRVVVWTWNLDAGRRHRALAAGASGCLPIQCSTHELVAELENAGTMSSATSRVRSARATAGAFDRSGHAGGLSEREAAVLELIALGMSNDDVARTMFLSINTVKSYIRSAYRKIGVNSRSQAVLWVVNHGDGAPTQRPARTAETMSPLVAINAPLPSTRHQRTANP